MKIVVVMMTLAGIAFIAGLFILLFLPTHRENRKISDKIIAAHTELQAQYSNRKNLTDSLKKVASIRQTSKYLNSQFLRPGDELLFITRVEDLAAKNEVEASIRLGLSRRKTKTSKQELVNDVFDLTFGGTFQAVQRSLVELESLTNIVIIESVGISAVTATEDGPPTVRMTIKGRLVYLTEEL